MDYKELYETNEEFREYVDRYRKDRGKTVEEALQEAMVGCYAHWLLHRDD